MYFLLILPPDQISDTVNHYFYKYVILFGSCNVQFCDIFILCAYHIKRGDVCVKTSCVNMC